MAARVYLPSAVAFIAAFVLLELGSSIGQHELLAGMARVIRLASVGAMAWAAILFIYASVRLFRADRGKGVLCNCGGLLGREINGRYGPFRRCMRCSRNVPQREYEME